MSGRLTRVMPRAIGTALVAIVAAGVIGIASQPTGAATPDGLVPATARLAGSTTLGEVRVLLLSEPVGMRVLVAYHGSKGWLAVAADPVASTAQAAWTATPGGGAVPALAVAYGRAAQPVATGTMAKIGWADGTTTEVPVAADGSWLSARPGQVRTRNVDVTDASGRVVARVSGP